MTATSPWSTASFGATTDTTPMELAVLGEHLLQCSAGSARLIAVQCGAQRLQGFVAGRLVTTLAVLAALIGAYLLLSS